MTQRMRLVPEVATEEMWDGAVKGSRADISYADAEEAWPAMIAASPNGGFVTDADLERAAVVFMKRRYFVQEGDELRVESIREVDRLVVEDALAAALAAIGLALASQPTQTGE